MEQIFHIDYFELCFLAEACIPPVPIARSMFWDSLIDVHYNKLTPGQREQTFEWIQKNPRFDLANEGCARFAARFDPNNQYLVKTRIDEKEEEHIAYMYKGRFFISKMKSINEDFIYESEKI